MAGIVVVPLTVTEMLVPFSVSGRPGAALDCKLEIAWLFKLLPVTMKRLPGAIP